MMRVFCLCASADCQQVKTFFATISLPLEAVGAGLKPIIFGMMMQVFCQCASANTLWVKTFFDTISLPLEAAGVSWSFWVGEESFLLLCLCRLPNESKQFLPLYISHWKQQEQDSNPSLLGWWCEFSTTVPLLIADKSKHFLPLYLSHWVNVSSFLPPVPLPIADKSKHFCHYISPTGSSRSRTQSHHLWDDDASFLSLCLCR